MTQKFYSQILTPREFKTFSHKDVIKLTSYCTAKKTLNKKRDHPQTGRKYLHCRPALPLLCSVLPHPASPSTQSAGRRWARPAPRSRGRAAAVRTPGKSFRNRAAPHPSRYCRGSAGERPPPSGGSPEQPRHKGCAPCPADSGGAAPRTPSLSPIPQTGGQGGIQ